MTLAPPHINASLSRQLRRPRRHESPDPLATLDQVPWARIWHWYGPAGEIPDAIRGLERSDHERCVDRLAACIEHQDGFSHAGALAIPFMCELLLAGRVRSPSALATLMEVFQRTADDVILSSPPHEGTTFDALLAPDRVSPAPIPLVDRGFPPPPGHEPLWYDHVELAVFVADELAWRLPDL